jgi:hypothetical protein
MRLSPLQKFILKTCYTATGKVVTRAVFTKFYDTQKMRPKASDIVNIITHSLESLIDKGLLVGYGVRTPEKWYIKEVRLLPQGRRLARKLLGEQQSLPLKLTKVNNKK